MLQVLGNYSICWTKWFSCVWVYYVQSHVYGATFSLQLSLIKMKSFQSLVPFRSGVQLNGHHLDAIPRSHTDATEQTLQSDDHCWAGTEEQQEGAAGWNKHGATW